MLGRISLLIFWLVILALSLVAVGRWRTGSVPDFRGQIPEDVPRWGYVIIPFALLGFVYLFILTLLYIWNPAIVLGLLWFNIPMDGIVIGILVLIGSLLTLVGTVIFLTAFFHLGSSVRLLIPDEEERTELMTDGWYAYSRNPLYLGLHISMVGWVFIMPDVLTVLALVVFLLNQHFRIISEEKFLEERFGEEYHEYKKRVRRYL
jgi:protein-S-isoprenylcysteine O-methyltransferase Ste14